MTDCQCTKPGWCERHQCRKTEYWLYLCQTQEDYFQLWESGNGPGQTPDPTRRKKTCWEKQKAGELPNLNLPGYGPGTELKKMLAWWGIHETKTCKCHEHAVIMDRWGADKCEQRMDVILGWIKAEAQRRKLPYVEMVGKMLVRRAIKRARARTE